MMTAELGGAIVNRSGAELALLAGLGGHYMNADERLEIARRCTAGCFFEAPSYRNGWSLLGKASAALSIRMTQRLDFRAGASYAYLSDHANHGIRYTTFSAGVGFRW